VHRWFDSEELEMIRPLSKCVLTLGALALLASPAWAQGRGGFGGPGFLMAPNVQKDLKLSDEQIGKVQGVLREVNEKHADERTAIRELPQEERPAKQIALSKTITEEVKTALALSADQSKRFDQIALQARGFQAFMDPTVIEKLKVTDEQKSKIREIAEASRAGGGGFANLKDASEEERAAAFKKMAETRKENMAKVTALLTDDQKKAWKDLTGEPIEIPFGPPRRPNN
jgi:hypothetical protein